MVPRIETLAQLSEAYPKGPVGPAVAKESDRITPLYAELIAASPFCVLATATEDGIDCSPRGDGPGFVQVRDEHTLVLPDRRGNNRLDSLHNLLADPRIGLMFMIPGVNECIRARGTAVISTDPDELARHEVNGTRPASVFVITVEKIYFQCARALIRSDLWNPEIRVERSTLPTAGRLVEEQRGMTSEEAADYDARLDQRQRASLY